MPTQPAPEVPEGEDGPRLSDYINKPVVLIPIKNDTVNSKEYGDSEVTVCDLWVLEGQKIENPGEVFVFWKKLRRQLDSFVGTGTAISGTIVRDGRAYVLQPLPAPLQAAVDTAFDGAEAAAEAAF